MNKQLHTKNVFFFTGFVICVLFYASVFSQHPYSPSKRNEINKIKKYLEVLVDDAAYNNRISRHHIDSAMPHFFVLSLVFDNTMDSITHIQVYATDTGHLHELETKNFWIKKINCKTFFDDNTVAKNRQALQLLKRHGAAIGCR